MIKSFPLSVTLFSAIALRIFCAGIVLLSSAVLARWLNPADFGRYALVLSAVALVAIPLTSGLPTVLVTKIADFVHRDRRDYIRGILIFCSAIAAALVSVYFLIGVSLSYLGFLSLDLSLVLVSCALVLIMSLDKFRAAALQGLGQGILSQIPEFAIKPLLVLVTFCLLWLSGFPANHLLALFGLVTSSLLALFAGGVFLRRSLPDLRNSDFVFASREWLKLAFTFGTISAIGTVTANTDTLLVGALAGADETGFYRVGIQTAAVMLLAQSGMGAVLSARIAGNFARGELREVIHASDYTSGIDALFSLGFFCTLLIWAEEIVATIFGAEYLPSTTVVQIVSAGHLANSLTGPGLMLLTLGKAEGKALRCMAAGGSITILGCVMTIPYLGGEGAAISLATGATIANIALAASTRRSLGFDPSVLGILSRIRMKVGRS